MACKSFAVGIFEEGSTTWRLFEFPVWDNGSYVHPGFDLAKLGFKFGSLCYAGDPFSCSYKIFRSLKLLWIIYG